MSSEHYLGGFSKTYNIAICIYSFLFITVILKVTKYLRRNNAKPVCRSYKGTWKDCEGFE